MEPIAGTSEESQYEKLPVTALSELTFQSVDNDNKLLFLTKNNKTVLINPQTLKDVTVEKKASGSDILKAFVKVPGYEMWTPIYLAPGSNSTSGNTVEKIDGSSEQQGLSGWGNQDQPEILNNSGRMRRSRSGSDLQFRGKGAKKTDSYERSGSFSDMSELHKNAVPRLAIQQAAQIASTPKTSVSNPTNTQPAPQSNWLATAKDYGSAYGLDGAAAGAGIGMTAYLIRSLFKNNKDALRYFKKEYRSLNPEQRKEAFKQAGMAALKGAGALASLALAVWGVKNLHTTYGKRNPAVK